MRNTVTRGERLTLNSCDVRELVPIKQILMTVFNSLFGLVPYHFCYYSSIVRTESQWRNHSLVSPGPARSIFEHHQYITFMEPEHPLPHPCVGYNREMILSNFCTEVPNPQGYIPRPLPYKSCTGSSLYCKPISRLLTSTFS
jgi:hypothetical protein